MATSSCSSSSSSTNYDVFLSFRGKDTRRQFTCHLRTELERDGTLTFKDDESLNKGEEIARIFDAIAGSRMSIPIFSQNYCDSKWCLDEIVKIMEARKEKGQIVFPIFYHVSPGDVKNQTGSFGQQFQQLAVKSDPDKVESWKKALKQAGKLVGLIIREDNQLLWTEVQVR